MWQAQRKGRGGIEGRGPKKGKKEEGRKNIRGSLVKNTTVDAELKGKKERGQSEGRKRNVGSELRSQIPKLGKPGSKGAGEQEERETTIGARGNGSCLIS